MRSMRCQTSCEKLLRGDFLTEEEVINEEELPLPMAPIVRLMKKNLDKDKLIKSQVKIAMNKWLGEICERVAKTMNMIPYTSVDLAAFKEAIKTYEDLEEMQKEKERVVASLEKIKQDCDSLIRDFNRKFD